MSLAVYVGIRQLNNEVTMLGPTSPLHGPTLSKFISKILHLNDRDVLLLYTDGVIEARRSGEPFGKERLKDLLINKDSDGLEGKIIETISAFSKKETY